MAVKSKSKKAATAVAEAQELFVYLGPTIRGVIQKGSFFSGTRESVEAQLSGAIAKYPSIKGLIVSGDTLAEDRLKLKTPGNLLSKKYAELAAEIKKS